MIFRLCVIWLDHSSIECITARAGQKAFGPGFLDDPSVVMVSVRPRSSPGQALSLSKGRQFMVRHAHHERIPSVACGSGKAHPYPYSASARSISSSALVRVPATVA